MFSLPLDTVCGGQRGSPRVGEVGDGNDPDLHHFPISTTRIFSPRPISSY